MNVIEAVPHYPEADTFQFRLSLANLGQAVVARKWVVVATTVLTTALVIGYIWIWPPTFEAELMIAADSEKDLQRAAFYQGWNTFRRESLGDEATLMTSVPVLKVVAQRLDLRYEEVYHPFASYLVHLWGESYVGKNYRKVKSWVFPKKPNPYEPSAEDIERYKVLADFREGVRLQQVKDASIGVLVVRGSTQRVAEIANTIADVYMEQRRERHVREASEAYSSLREETEKAQKEMSLLELDLRQFRSDNGLFLVFEKDRVQVGQWQAQRTAIADLEASIAESENALRTINRQLSAESEYIKSDRLFKDVAGQDRLTKLEAQLAQTRQLFQPNSPEVRELEEKSGLHGGHRASEQHRRRAQPYAGRRIVRGTSRQEERDRVGACRGQGCASGEERRSR